MAGVDFLDRIISYYRISVRTRKWPIRVIMHFFDLAISAGWIEYRRDQLVLGTPRKDRMDLMAFKEQYAEFLIKVETPDSTHDSDPDYGCSLPRPRKQPRGPHPSDLKRKKHAAQLLEFPN